MANKIQLRRDTTANWNRVNPILDDGEPGLNIDTNQIKYGDGANAWNNLPYSSSYGNSDVASYLTTGATAITANVGNVLTTGGVFWAGNNAPYSTGSSGSVTVLDKDRYAPPRVSDFPTLLGTNTTNPNVSYNSTTGLRFGFGMNLPNDANHNRGLFKTLPSTAASWDATYRLKVYTRGFEFWGAGVALRNSSSSKLVTFGMNTYALVKQRWNDELTFWEQDYHSSNYSMVMHTYEWYRISWDQPNNTFWFKVSHDGTNWTTVESEGYNGFFTPMPNQIGLYLYNRQDFWPTPSIETDWSSMQILYYDDPDIPASSRTI